MNAKTRKGQCDVPGNKPKLTLHELMTMKEEDEPENYYDLLAEAFLTESLTTAAKGYKSAVSTYIAQKQTAL